jgi:F0F1-type ATP synthase assembly protein I
MPRKMLPLGREFVEATSISIELVVPVVLGAFAGYWLDGKLRTYPGLLILGVFLGAVSGMWTVYKNLILNKK